MLKNFAESPSCPAMTKWSTVTYVMRRSPHHRFLMFMSLPIDTSKMKRNLSTDINVDGTSNKREFPSVCLSFLYIFHSLFFFFFFYQKRKEKLSWFSTLSFIFLHFFTQAKKSCIHFLPPSFSFICILSGFCYNFILCSFFLFFFCKIKSRKLLLLGISTQKENDFQILW